MDRNQMNQTALALAALAILLSLAAMAPLGQPIPQLLALVGFMALVGALQLVRPRPGDEDRTPAPWTNLVGSIAAGLVAVLVVLVGAGLLARIAGVTYLGSVAILIAQRVTLITGPFVITIAAAVLLAARGEFRPPAEAPTPTRRAISGGVHGLAALVSLLIALGVLPGEAWQAPYPLALAGVVLWYDAQRFAGLPTPGAIGAWLERGDTAQSRAVLRFLAITGNAIVIVAALGASVLHILGYQGFGVLAEVAAMLVMLAATYAASTLRSAIPLELEEDPSLARQQVAQLRLLALGPLFVSLAAGLLVMLSTLGIGGGGGGIGSAALIARPALGGLVAVLAGINLARSRMRSYEKATETRRAIWITATSILVGAGFFSATVHTGVMVGPIVASGIGLTFDYLVLLAVAVFVASRGLYPMPWTAPKKDKGPEAKETAEDYREKVERSLLTVYIASGVFLMAMIGLLAATALGLFEVPLPKSPEGRNAAFLAMIGFGMLLILGLVALFVQSRRVKDAPSEKVEFKKRYTPDEVARLAVLGTTGTLAVVLGFLGLLVLLGQLQSLGSLELQAKHSTDFFVFAILIGLGPAGFLYNRERKRIQAIDAQLPEFLRDLAESQRTGMTLTQAVITASRGNYGALTPEVRKMAAQIEWGVSFEDALMSFAKRVDTPLVQRTVTLIIEAQSSGGNVIDVLTAASEDAREIQMINTERKGGMQIYVMIIYIAFLVFLGVIAILNVKFMPEVAKAVAGASGVTVGSITFAEFDIQAFRTLFFHAAVIQGLGGGFVAGAMEEGKPVAGLKHAFAMTIIAYVTFRFLLGG